MKRREFITLLADETTAPVLDPGRGRVKKGIGRSSPWLIETCKMNGVNPQAYLRDVLARIVARHPVGRIDDLLPFAYVSAADKAAA